MKEEHDNSCNRIKGQLDSYLKDTLDPAQSSFIEKHIAGCPLCSAELDRLENHIFAESGTTKANQEELRRIENRFAFKVSENLLAVLCAVLVGWYGIFGLLLPRIFADERMEKVEGMQYAIQDLILFTEPGAKIADRSGYVGYGYINLYTKGAFESNLVGGGKKITEFDWAVPIYWGKSDFKRTVRFEGKGMGFSFKNARGKSTLTDKWDQIESYGNGTRTQIALYLESPISLEEMERILRKINADSNECWMALDTGDLQLKETFSTAVASMPEWGFPLYIPLTPATADTISYSSDGKSRFMHGGGGDVYDLRKISEYFKSEMKAFERSSSLFDDKSLTEEIRKINNFLDSNPVKIRGAILAAPSSDILKLMDETGITRIDILNVDFDYSSKR